MGNISLSASLLFENYKDLNISFIKTLGQYQPQNRNPLSVCMAFTCSHYYYLFSPDGVQLSGASLFSCSCFCSCCFSFCCAWTSTRGLTFVTPARGPGPGVPGRHCGTVFLSPCPGVAPVVAPLVSVCFCSVVRGRVRVRVLMCGCVLCACVRQRNAGF